MTNTALAGERPGPGSDDWDGSADRRAVPGLRLPADRAADGAQAVRHVDEAVPGPGLVGVEAGPVVADREQEPAGLLPDADLRAGLRCVLGRVLQGLQAAEVDRGLHPLGVAPDAVGAHRDRDRAPARRGAQRV